MARKIKLSVLGPRPLEGAEQDAPDIVLEKMKVHWQKQLEAVVYDKPDLILLHEVCDRPAGYTVEENTKYYNYRDTAMLEFFIDAAKTHNTYIAYSAVRKMDNGTFRNSTQLIDRQGSVRGIYDKVFPTVNEINKANIVPGDGAVVLDCDFGRVGFAICFDLNFEALRLQYEALKPDLILFSSMYHGGLMANYWAYSCRTYLVGAISGLESYVIAPTGDKIAHSTNYFSHLTTEINLDQQMIHLDENWDKIQKIKEKYGPAIVMSDPGYVGAVMLTAESDELSIKDIIQEFQVETLDEYFNRSIQERDLNVKLI